MSFSESWYLENVGLDAVMYLRFLRMALRICLITGIVVGVFLLPINFYGRPDEGCPLDKPASGPLSNILNATQSTSDGPFSGSAVLHSTNSVARFSVDNICKGSNWFWVHALMTCVISVTTMYQLYRETWAYMMLRRAYLVAKGRQGAIHLRTIMVSQLPSDLQDDDALKSFFEAMECGKVLSAKVVRHMGGLARKIDRRENILSQIELAHIQLVRNIANGLTTSDKGKNMSAVSSNTELFNVEVVADDEMEKEDDPCFDLASDHEEAGASTIRPALMPPSLVMPSDNGTGKNVSSPINPMSPDSESKSRHDRYSSGSNASDHLRSLASSFPTPNSPPDIPFPWDMLSSIPRSALDRFQPTRPPPIFANLLRRLLRKPPIPVTDAIRIPRRNKSRQRRKESCEKKSEDFDEGGECGARGSDQDIDADSDFHDEDSIVARPLIDKLMLKYHYLDRRVRDLRQKALRATIPENGARPFSRQDHSPTNNHTTSPDLRAPSSANSPVLNTPDTTAPYSSTSPAALDVPRNQPYDTYCPETPVSPFEMTTTPALRPVTARTSNSANSWNSGCPSANAIPVPRQIFRPTSTGFVTFRSHVSASLAAQSIVRGVPHSCTTRMAPEPRDIIWENLSLQLPGALKYNLLRRIAVSIACWAVIVLWLFPSSAIFTLTVQELLTSENADGVLGLFGGQRNEWILNLMTSTLPTALTAMQQVMMPHIFWGLTSLERPITYSSLEEKVLKRYYQWAFLNIFVLFMFARAIGYAIITGIQNPAQILLLLARFLPEGSTFFINFVLFSTCLHSLELLQLGVPLLAAAFVTSSKVSRSPRQLHRNTFPLSFPYYYYYPNHTLIFSLGIIYSTINPLILLAAAVYFAFANVVFRYQFAFAYVRRYEGAGRLWIVMVRHVTGGLVLYQLTILGEMLLKGAYATLFILLPLFAATISFDVYWKRTFLRRTKFLSMDTGLQFPNMEDEDQFDAMSPGAAAASDADADEEVCEAPTTHGKDPLPSGTRPPGWPTAPTTRENRAAEEAYAHRSASWAYPGKNEEWGRQVFAVAEALNAAEARGDSSTVPVDVPMVSGTGIIGAGKGGPGGSVRSAGLSRGASAYFSPPDSSAGGQSSSFHHAMIPNVVVVKPGSAEGAVPVSSFHTSSSTSSLALHSSPGHLSSRIRPFLNVALPSLVSPVSLLTSTFTFLQNENPSNNSGNLPQNPVPPNSYQPRPPPKQPHHLQDEDSPYQTYTHPCLIRPLPTKLWLPVNPLRKKIDLDETIQLDKVIVSSRALRDAKRMQDANYLQERARARMWRERKAEEAEEREGRGEGCRRNNREEIPRMSKWRQKRVDEGVLTSTTGVIAWSLGFNISGHGTRSSKKAASPAATSEGGTSEAVEAREIPPTTEGDPTDRGTTTTTEKPNPTGHEEEVSKRGSGFDEIRQPRTPMSVRTRKSNVDPPRRRDDRRGYALNHPEPAGGCRRQTPAAVLQMDRLETASGTSTGVFLSGLESEEWEELSSGESEY